MALKNVNVESNSIFDSNLNLPSIEGIKSTCEDELYLLMKEVDLAFERKHKDLLVEVSKLRASCQEKTSVIENLKSMVSKTQNYKSTVDQVKHLSKELEKMKEENSKLKKENDSLKKRAQRVSETEHQNENLLRSLAIQQEENISLNGRMRRLSEKHSILQENYQKLLNIMTSEQKADGKGDEKHDEKTLPCFIDAFVAQETENYLKEEMEHCHELQTKIYEEIDAFQQTVGDETV